MLSVVLAVLILNLKFKISNFKTYHANGKLLLTAEYLVLDGATALALPAKYGQNMTVTTEQGSGQVFWIGYDVEGKEWLSCQFQLPIEYKHDDSVVKLLKQLFQEALKQNSTALDFETDYHIKTYLEFPRLWGLGSSSTMIYNLSQWLAVDPYQLLSQTMGGSGYDLACASSDKPLLYQLDKSHPMVSTVDFNPVFADQLYFIYLNQKQTSSKEISRYKSNSISKDQAVIDVNAITHKILMTKCIDDFNALLYEHERIVSFVLQRPVVQEQFSDFDGQLKSLGAWGGDFILASGGKNTVGYFKSKGFDTVVHYKEMIK